jgi:hypothetical protein
MAGRPAGGGISTLAPPRVIGTWCVARWGRCRRPSGLSSRLTTGEVVAMGGQAVDCGAAAACSADGRTAALASHSLEWSAARESRRKTWSKRGRCRGGDRHIDREIGAVDPPTTLPGSAQRSAPWRAGAAGYPSVRDPDEGSLLLLWFLTR